MARGMTMLCRIALIAAFTVIAKHAGELLERFVRQFTYARFGAVAGLHCRNQRVIAQMLARDNLGHLFGIAIDPVPVPSAGLGPRRLRLMMRCMNIIAGDLVFKQRR